MRDNVFIGWSGSNEVAVRVKQILERDYNYICYIGGNSDNSSMFASVGDTVIQQIKTCNQAIMIFCNKADGSVSNNLFFELGYVFACYGAKKVHCVKKARENVVLPSDFDNSFVEPVDDDDFVDGIIRYFLSRQKMSIDVNKMMLINNRYRIHDIIQSHYSQTGSRCSDYELAQYLLFYMQAAHMFGDIKKVNDEISVFKKLHYYEFSTELGISVNICLSFFDMITEIRADERGEAYIDSKSFRKYVDSCEDLLEDIPDDDEGTFDEWAHIFVADHLSYAHMLFAECPENDAEMRENIYRRSEKYCLATLKYIEILENMTAYRENNDRIGLLSLIKSYLYRNMFVCHKVYGDGEEIKWLELTRKERKTLLRNFSQGGSIDSALYENFRMEYYLTLSECLLYADKLGIDKFELKLYADEIKNFFENVKKGESSPNIYIKQIERNYGALGLDK